MILSNRCVSSVLQMHSRDYLLRLTPQALGRIVWHHLCTVEDPTVLDSPPLPGVRVGYIEWSGLWQGQMASLAWDWVSLSDGALQVLPGVAPRSNLRLLGVGGYDMDAQAETAAMWAFISTLDWAVPTASALGRPACVDASTPGSRSAELG